MILVIFTLFPVTKECTVLFYDVIIIGLSSAVRLLEARHAAANYKTKFTEVSTVLNHGIDDLLVGILKQIKGGKVPGNDKDSQTQHRNSLTRLSKWLPKAGRNMLEKIVSKKHMSRSSENLVLQPECNK